MFLTGWIVLSNRMCFAVVTGLKSLKYSVNAQTVVSDDFFFTETVEDRVRHEDKTDDNYAAGELVGILLRWHISHLKLSQMLQHMVRS